MIFKKYIAVVLIVACITMLMSGCGNSKQSNLPEFSQFEPYISQVSEAELPSSGIIALGEATHGNKEFTLLKLEVFQKIVEQSNIRAFAIEGDFGGGQKVNQFIQNGEGTSIEAASEIGFDIYKTEEMVQLLDWMHNFNKDKQENEQIRFYGYDMQRYDNNKESLLNYLEQCVPELKEKYSDTLAGFTDDTMFDLEESIVKETITELESLNLEVEKHKDNIVEVVGEKGYDLILMYAKTILENSNLRIANNYGTLRDKYMAEHVQWIYEFDAKYYNTDGIFIAGHNGHTGKTNATVGTEKSMGQILSEQYDSDYYSIGTEFNSSHFLAPDDSGERKEFRIQNNDDSRLAVLLNQSNESKFFVNLDEAANDTSISDYIKTKQSMSSIGEYFSDIMAMSEKGYTQKLSPQETFNSLIFIKSATPSNMLNK